MNHYLKHFSGRTMPVEFGLDTNTRRTIAFLSGTTAVGLGLYLWKGWNPLRFILPGGVEEYMAENQRKMAENQRKIAELQRKMAQEDALYGSPLLSGMQQQFSSQQFSSDSQDYDYEAMYKKAMQKLERDKEK